jgi:hypothetical protein
MTEYASARPAPDSAGSTWAGGISIFAASMMIIVGVFEMFEGLVAVVNGDDFLDKTRDYVLQMDTTAWGWTHLLLGLVVAGTGAAIVAGSGIARWVGVVIVSLSALANFAWIPYYPLWALVVLTLDVLVIWAFASADFGRR